MWQPSGQSTVSRPSRQYTPWVSLPLPCMATCLRRTLRPRSPLACASNSPCSPSTPTRQPCSLYWCSPAAGGTRLSRCGSTSRGVPTWIRSWNSTERPCANWHALRRRYAATSRRRLSREQMVSLPLARGQATMTPPVRHEHQHSMYEKGQEQTMHEVPQMKTNTAHDDQQCPAGGMSPSESTGPWASQARLIPTALMGPAQQGREPCPIILPHSAIRGSVAPYVPPSLALTGSAT